jgi:hypothetical protein
MKKIIIPAIILILFNINNLIFSQELILKIVEKTGTVNFKIKDGEWKELKLNDVVANGVEITTGFHSRATIEIGTGSYITMNQLSNILIDKVLLNKEENSISIKLNNGYVNILSKPIANIKNKIFVNVVNGSMVEFDKSEGEVYFRSDKGTAISSHSGIIKISTRFTKVYSINKDEECGISVAGQIIESDYYLKRKINAIPSDIKEEQAENGYYDQFFQPYTSDYPGSDYRNHSRH